MNDDDARGAGHGARKARDPRAVDDHVREKDARDEKWIDDADEARDAQRGDGEETRDVRGVVRGGARARGRARWGRHARVRVGTVGQLFDRETTGEDARGCERSVGSQRARECGISRYFLESCPRRRSWRRVRPKSSARRRRARATALFRRTPSAPSCAR